MALAGGRLSGSLAVFRLMFQSHSLCLQVLTKANDRVFISHRDFALWALGFVGFIVLFMILFTLLTPWRWIETFNSSTDIFGRSSSFYSCRSEDGTSPYSIVIVVAQALMVLLGCLWCYQTRELETEYHETQYISYALILLMETVLIGLPLFSLLESTRLTSFSFGVGSVFLICSVLLSLIFLPKMMALRRERQTAEAEARMAQNVHGHSSQRSSHMRGGPSGRDDDDDDSDSDSLLDDKGLLPSEIAEDKTKRDTAVTASDYEASQPLQPEGMEKIQRASDSSAPFAPETEPGQPTAELTEPL